MKSNKKALVLSLLCMSFMSSVAFGQQNQWSFNVNALQSNDELKAVMIRCLGSISDGKYYYLDDGANPTLSILGNDKYTLSYNNNKDGDPDVSNTSYFKKIKNELHLVTVNEKDLYRCLILPLPAVKNTNTGAQ